MDKELLEVFAKMYIEFCRLKGYKAPKSKIEVMIDQAAGVEDAHMKEFAQWIKDEILPRWALV